jgi:hypothetical protein
MIEFIISSLIYISIPVGISILLIHFLKRNQKLADAIGNANILISVLIAWITIGFIRQLDYDQECGCMITRSSIFEYERILYSSISLLLVVCALFIKKLRATFLFTELIIWLLKLYFLKRGYAVGIAGIPSFYIFNYDFISILIRLWLISRIIGKRKLKAEYLSLIAGSLLFLKMFFIPCPDDTIKQKYIAPYLTQKLKKEINGEWNGKTKWKILVEKNYKDSIDFSFTLKLDSTNNHQIEVIDTFPIPYDYEIKAGKNQKIFSKFGNIKMHMVGECLRIEGLEGYSNNIYKISYMSSSINPIISFSILNKDSNDESTIQDKIQSRFNSFQLSIDRLDDNELSGVIDNVYIIEMKKER